MLSASVSFKTGKVFPTRGMKACRESGCIAPFMRNFGNR